MYRALVRKELRQLLPLIVLAALAYGPTLHSAFACVRLRG